MHIRDCCQIDHKNKIDRIIMKKPTPIDGMIELDPKRCIVNETDEKGKIIYCNNYFIPNYALEIIKLVSSHCTVDIYKQSSIDLLVKLKFFANTHNTST